MTDTRTTDPSADGLMQAAQAGDADAYLRLLHEITPRIRRIVRRRRPRSGIIAAAIAAFATVVPGHDRKLFALPLVPLAVWLGSLGRGCVQDWIQLGRPGLSLQPDWVCLPSIVLVGLVPAFAMAIMLRRGAPLTPYLTTALGGLAAAGLGNFGLRLFHPQDASVMVLFWQVGAVFMVTALAGWAGGYWLTWHAVGATARRDTVMG